jgi:hypothetical protein
MSPLFILKGYTMKLISKTQATIGTGDFLVKVYKDSEWNEYVCRLFINGEESVDSSYHTDDKQDALDTANSMLGFYRIRLELIQDGVI